MPDDATTEHLLAVLATIRERGPIGEASLVAAVQRADAFVALVPESAQHLVDLGSGGGLPGLVIAVRRPDLMVTLVERRRTRADLLERAVRGLELADRVRVSSDDAQRMARGAPGSFDVVTARSFGPSDLTLRLAAALVRSGGVVLIAEPPEERENRWPTTLLAECEVVDQGRCDGVRSFARS